MVEHSPCKRKVVSSILTGGSVRLLCLPANLILKSTLVAAGIGLAAAFGGTVVAASPSSSVSAQDTDSNVDGAAIDTDGTQGDYKPAMDGTVTGAQMSTPQYKAGG